MLPTRNACLLIGSWNCEIFFVCPFVAVSKIERLVEAETNTNLIKLPIPKRKMLYWLMLGRELPSETPWTIRIKGTNKCTTGRERLIPSHSSARFCFELSGNSN